MCPKNSDFLLGINRLSLALRHDLCTAKKSPPKNLRESEQILRNSGFKQFRVRIHGDIARIELLPEDFEKMLKMREELYASIKALGFSYVTMDLQGYRTGSMNEVIATDK